MNTFYVIRQGWNSANQSSLGSKRNPKNKFESRQCKLVGIVEADSEQSAIEKVRATCYSGQFVFATANPRSVKGLTEEARYYAEFVEMSE